MTVTTFISLKGAPGVTTLTCLVGATWPETRKVAVVESDPFGGDLAVRFQLSSAWGWSSYLTAARRSDGFVPIEPHLQPIPGGLDVIVLPAGDRGVVDVPSVDALLRSAASPESETRDLLIDGGRLAVRLHGNNNSESATAAWLERSDRVVVVTWRDPASLFKVRDWAATLRNRFGDRVVLTVVGRGAHDLSAAEEFTGLPVLGAVPHDTVAAQIATGERQGVRRLSRSQLLGSARRLSLALSNPGIDQPNDRGVPAESSVVAAKGIGPMGRVTRTLRSTLQQTGRHRSGANHEVSIGTSAGSALATSPPDAVSGVEWPLPQPPEHGSDDVPIKAVVP